MFANGSVNIPKRKLNKGAASENFYDCLSEVILMAWIFPKH